MNELRTRPGDVVLLNVDSLHVPEAVKPGWDTCHERRISTSTAIRYMRIGDGRATRETTNSRVYQRDICWRQGARGRRVKPTLRSHERVQARGKVDRDFKHRSVLGKEREERDGEGKEEKGV
ncbi:hypothetical protein DFH07DRAFT_774062 [Mycena maculata]|uniref:Uncharacterized protein n=1 Tax=Mycena maculata TaxID=230809 RepID=A0AAD7IZN7_9AGAR|nr:hypothetical protein DFH07DRAFT_774062 [Mycena maculata]